MRYWNEVYINNSTFEKAVETGKTNNHNSFIYNYF